MSLRIGAAAAGLLQRRSFHASQPVLAGQEYRLRNGLPMRGQTEFSEIADAPDWSYASTGEPAPTTYAQYRRKKRRLRYWVKATELEADVAREYLKQHKK